MNGVEGGIMSPETLIQYTDPMGRNHKLPIVLEKSMLRMTINEMKEELLQCESMKVVQESPERLAVFLATPSQKDGDYDVREMLGHQKFSLYTRDFFQGGAIRLVAKH